MGLYQRYKTDERLETEGTWVDFGDGVRFRILSEHSPKLRGLRKTQQKKYRNYLLAMDVPPHIEDTMQVEQAVAAVAGWDGVTDEAGKALPYTAENVRKVLTDLRDLRRDVLFASGTAETFKPSEVVEAMGKTSPPPSEPS